MSVREEFLQAAGGDVNVASANLAHGLMRGDPTTLKAGYGRESALLTAFEVYESSDGLDEDRVRTLLEGMEHPGR